MQISDDLIQYITSELMKRVRPDAPAEALAPAKPLLHLVGRREDLSTPALARIQESFEVREHLNWDDELPREASVLITSLNIQALVRVTEGDEGCTVEGRALLAALLNGQPVAALRDGLVWRRYLNTAPRGLLARYGHCENVLQGYGLKLVDEDQVAEALLGHPLAAPKSPQTLPVPAPPAAAPAFTPSGSGRRVWSEAKVMEACPASRGPGQTLRLSPGDVLTPLAQDYLLAMKINLVKG